MFKSKIAVWILESETIQIVVRPENADLLTINNL